MVFAALIGLSLLESGYADTQGKSMPLKTALFGPERFPVSAGPGTSPGTSTSPLQYTSPGGSNPAAAGGQTSTGKPLP